MDSNLAASAAAETLIKNINGVIVNPLIILMFTFALVAFLWGVREYITGADNPEARIKGTTHIMWGIIGMALMFMSFTIVRIVIQTFGIGNGKTASGKSDPTLTEINKVLKRQ